MFNNYISLADDLGVVIPPFITVHTKLKCLPTYRNKCYVRNLIIVQRKAKRMFPKDFVKRNNKLYYFYVGENVKFLKRV